MEKEKTLIFLIGFMGAGKTTVGDKLSAMCHAPYFDLDEFIEKEHGLTISQIFELYGEKTFRKWEKEALNHFTTMEKGIIATGGGVVEDEENIQLMKNNGVVVYLKAPFETLFERIKNDPSRPLTKEGKDFLRKRFEKRSNLYEKATIIIETENKTVNDVAKEVLELIQE